MSFSLTIGQSSLKKDILHSLKTAQVAHSQCIIDYDGRGGLALALDYAFSLLYTEIPDSLEKALQHPDLQFIYPVTTSNTVKNKPLCEDYVSDWRNFLQQNIYGSLFDWLAHIGSDNKQGNIGVDHVSELLKSLSLKPYMGGNKVCLIWGAEKMNNQAANKLLKLIEEPPKNTYFFFIIPDEEALIATLRSRSQLIFLPPVKKQMIQDYLTSLGNNDNDAKAISEISQGNIRLATQLSNTNEDIKNIETLLIECLRYSFSAKGNTSIAVPLMQWANKMGSLGRPLQKAFLHYGNDFIRQALLLSYQTPSLVHFKSRTEFSLEKFAPFVNSSNAGELIQLFENSSYAIERNANPKILFTDFCLQLTRLLNKTED